MGDEIFFWLILFVPAACAAGFASGLLGIGGGIVLIPPFYYVFAAGGHEDVALHLAIGTSLAVVVITTLSSFLAHDRRGAADRGIIFGWAAFLMFGAAFGGALAGYVSEITLSAIFGFGLLPLVVLLFLGPEPLAAPPSDEMPRGVRRMGLASAVGFGSSLMGIGGGSFGVPALVLCGQPIHRAIGTAAGFGPLIAFPGSLVLMVSGLGVEGLPAYSFGYVNYLVLLICAPWTVMFAPLGARVAHSLPQRLLRRIFAVFVLIISLRFLARAFL